MKKAVSDFLSRQWLNILECIDQGVVVVDPNATIQFMNEATAQLTGHSAARAVGRQADAVLGPSAWLAELFSATPDAPPPRHMRAELALTDRWGGQVPVQATATPLTDEQGEEIGTLLTLEDLSRRRDLEARGLEVERLAELESPAWLTRSRTRSPGCGAPRSSSSERLAATLASRSAPGSCSRRSTG